MFVHGVCAVPVSASVIVQSAPRQAAAAVTTPGRHLRQGELAAAVVTGRLQLVQVPQPVVPPGSRSHGLLKIDDVPQYSIPSAVQGTIEGTLPVTPPYRQLIADAIQRDQQHAGHDPAVFCSARALSGILSEGPPPCPTCGSVTEFEGISTDRKFVVYQCRNPSPVAGTSCARHITQRTRIHVPLMGGEQLSWLRSKERDHVAPFSMALCHTDAQGHVPCCCGLPSQVCHLSNAIGTCS